MRTKKTILNFVATIMLQVITGICGLIVPKLFIGTYGSEINGMISSINQFLSYITLFEAGLSGVIMSQLYKPLAQNDFGRCNSILADSRDFFKKIAMFYIVYVGIIAVVYPQIIDSSKSSIFISTLILILSVNLFLQYFFGINNCILIQAKQEGYIYSFLQIVVVLLNAVVVVLCTKIGTSVHFLKALAIVVASISPLGLYAYVRIKCKYIDQTQKGNSKNIKQRWDGMVHHICYYIQSNIDVFLLTFVDLKLVSVYSIYFMITSTIRKLFESFLVSFRSAMGDMYAKHEIELLHDTFSLLEFLIYSLSVAVFTAVYFSLLPFIRIYTSGITDINYVNRGFASLIIIAEVCYTIRIPYHTMVNCAGLFNETKKFAFQEAVINVLVSTVFVFKYGIIGVAIGTAVSCAYRTIRYFDFYTKNVLKLRWKKIISRISVQFFLTILIFFVFDFLGFESETYLEWVAHGFIYILISTVISFTANSIIFKDDAVMLLKKLHLI